MGRHKDSEAKANSSDVRFIPCRVEPGMFRDEFLVYLDVIDPQDPSRTITVQLLADRREVAKLRGTPKRNQPAAGWLRVALARQEKGLAQVVLPQPASPVGPNVLVEEGRVKHMVGA